MPKPVSRILVIEDDPLVLRELVKGLNAAARVLELEDQPCVRVLKHAEERGLRSIG